MLPSVLKYSHLHGDQQVQKRQQKVLDVLWEEKEVANFLKLAGLKQDSAGAGDVLAAIISALELPGSLKDVGVGRDKFDALAHNCLKDRWLKTNAVPLIEKNQVLEILDMAAGDGKSNL
jgi:alcohol dehydrogenase class IV